MEECLVRFYGFCHLQQLTFHLTLCFYEQKMFAVHMIYSMNDHLNKISG